MGVCRRILKTYVKKRFTLPQPGLGVWYGEKLLEAAAAPTRPRDRMRLSDTIVSSLKRRVKCKIRCSVGR